MEFAQRMSRIKPSPTLAASAKAKAMKAKGVPIINFGPGEPDFDTPEHIKAACVEALKAGITKYGPVPGIPELRQAIVDKLKRDNELDYSPNEIIVTCGAKEAIFAAMQVLLNAGDEVVIPAPYWVSYADQALLCEAKPVVVPTDASTHFKMTAAQLQQAITAKTKMLLLNSPCNPSGMVYSRKELAALGKVCQDKGIWVLTDEIYEALVYPPATFTSFGTACPEHRDRTILVNGVSKAYAMTGWRVGWIAAPEALVKKLTTWQGQVVTHATVFAQHGAVAAYTGPQDCVAKMRAAFEERRNFVETALNQIEGVTLTKPEGAFYAFPNVQAHLGKQFKGKTIAATTDLAEHLLEEAHIAVVAGEGFGMPGFLRISYALGMDDIKEGLQRFADGLAKLT